MDQLRQNLEDYRRQLDWQSKERGGASSLSRAGESDFREKLRKKDLEIAEQLDKIEVCILSVKVNCCFVLHDHMSDEFSIACLHFPHLPSSFLPLLSSFFLSLFPLAISPFFLPPYLPFLLCPRSY